MLRAVIFLASAAICGERRRRAADPGLLEQLLVPPEHREVGEVGNAVVLAPDRRELQVTRAERRLERQRVDVLRDVEQRALVLELRHVDVVQSDEVRRIARADRRGELAGVVVGRRQVQDDLQVGVRGVELLDEGIRHGRGRIPRPELNGARRVHAKRRRRLLRRRRDRREPQHDSGDDNHNRRPHILSRHYEPPSC